MSTARPVRHRWAWMMATWVALAALVVSCSSDDEPVGDAGAGLVGLFSLIPDRPETRSFIQFSDPARAADEMGVSVPADDAVYDRILDYVIALDLPGESAHREGGLPGPAPAVCGLLRARIEVDGMRPELGFSPTQVHQVIEAGLPPEAFCAMRGRFDPDHVDAVVRDEPTFSGLLEVAEVEGVAYYRWGPDGANASTDDAYQPTAARPIGEGGRLYVDADRLFWGRVDAVMEAQIAAAVTGTQASLADDDGIRALVEYFDDQGVFAGFVTDEATLEPERLSELGESFVFTRGVDLWGAGWGRRSDGGHLALLAVVSADADDTEDNVAAIAENIRVGASSLSARPWSERLEVVDTVADGRLGVVELTNPGSAGPDGPGMFLLHMGLRRDHVVVNRP